MELLHKLNLKYKQRFGRTDIFEAAEIVCNPNMKAYMEELYLAPSERDVNHWGKFNLNNNGKMWITYTLIESIGMSEEGSKKKLLHRLASVMKDDYKADVRTYMDPEMIEDLVLDAVIEGEVDESFLDKIDKKRLKRRYSIGIMDAVIDGKISMHYLDEVDAPLGIRLDTIIERIEEGELERDILGKVNKELLELYLIPRVDKGDIDPCYAEDYLEAKYNIKGEKNE
ncbi:hypothetical protein GF361_00265 [Candidatus Woesearchaeota archaeon]|nr:hypothetical protein [Candidatus Woesearchaeota archaeon]